MNTTERLEARLSALRTERHSWWLHWRELSEFILPRRYRWLVTPNDTRRGRGMNAHILDSTGTIAARDCAAGLKAGITNQTKKWFRLRAKGVESEGNTPVALWLAETERRMLRVFSESNFYNQMSTVFADLTVFGSAASIIYEDYDDVIRLHTPAVGEFFFANGPDGRVNTFFREFALTVDACVRQFGIENCSPQVQSMHKAKNLDREIIIAHAIEPGTGRFPYKETYWERGQPKPLRELGFFEWPLIAARWDTTASDAYGRGPGMDALPDIKQLQHMHMRKAQGIDKQVNPPLKADVQLKNQSVSSLPGGITFVSSLDRGGVAPIYEARFDLQHLLIDIAAVQERIRSVFFNDLFLMISHLDTVRTATEIDARREEKLLMLGPVLERFETEALDPAIDRVFNIMLRGGLLPEPPQELAEGAFIEVQYRSMMAEAQNAADTIRMERVMGFAGNLAGGNPTVLDNIDMDEAIRIYGAAMSVDPRVLRQSDMVDQIRAQREKQNQTQELLQQTPGAARAARLLSQTEVGGGQNALESLIGG